MCQIKCSAGCGQNDVAKYDIYLLYSGGKSTDKLYLSKSIAIK